MDWIPPVETLDASWVGPFGWKSPTFQAYESGRIEGFTPAARLYRALRDGSLNGLRGDLTPLEHRWSCHDETGTVGLWASRLMGDPSFLARFDPNPAMDSVSVLRRTRRLYGNRFAFAGLKVPAFRAFEQLDEPEARELLSDPGPAARLYGAFKLGKLESLLGDDATVEFAYGCSPRCGTVREWATRYLEDGGFRRCFTDV